MIYIVLLLGLVFRLISLNQSLWLDEATTALVSQMSVADFFSKFMPADFHPPLYYLVMHVWVGLFGDSEVSLRIPSIIFGMFTIYCVFLIAKRIKLKWPLVPALFLATSGLHVYYSQEARMYAMATFLVTLAVYLYVNKKWWLLAFTLPMVFLTDYLSLIILPVLFIYTYYKQILPLRDKDYKNIKIILKASIPLALSFIAWLPYLSKQLAAGIAIKSSSSGWWSILGPVTFKNIALIPTKFMIGRVNIDNKFIYLITIIIISIIFIYVIGKARNKLIWSWFGLSLFFGILISFFIPTLTYFRYLFILPAFYLLLSESRSKVFVVVILLINLVASGRYLFNSKFHREDWRGVANLIGSEKIVFPVNSQKEALVYYGKGDQIISSQELITNSHETVWLSRYVWNIFDPTDNTRIFIEKLGYNMTYEVNYNGVVFWKYTK